MWEAKTSTLPKPLYLGSAEFDPRLVWVGPVMALQQRLWGVAF